jgi:hypothetical protein
VFSAVGPLTGDEGRHPDGPNKITKFHFRGGGATPAHPRQGASVGNPEGDPTKGE